MLCFSFYVSNVSNLLLRYKLWSFLFIETPSYYAEHHLNNCDDKLIIKQRFLLYLTLQPKATIKFYCLIQGLPSDEKKYAVRERYLHDQVKKVLGHIIPRFILILDFNIIQASSFYSIIFFMT
jgi:hypothetical protein